MDFVSGSSAKGFGYNCRISTENRVHPLGAWVSDKPKGWDKIHRTRKFVK
jgi:hypothetical protein